MNFIRGGHHLQLALVQGVFSMSTSLFADVHKHYVVMVVLHSGASDDNTSGELIVSKYEGLCQLRTKRFVRS